MSYGQFAYVYDELMSDVDYDQWVSFLKDRELKYRGQQSTRILDLACGTGELSLRLANEGYQVVGVDLSEDMLTIANAKATEENKKIEFYQMDMTELSGLDPFDMIGIFCDSLNYLETEEQVKNTFKAVFNQLNDKGIFMFDVHSIYKMEHIFKDGTFVSSDEEISYIWNCFSGRYPYSVEHELSFFVRNEQTNEYQRFDENHYQRTFPIDQYQEWLIETGFTVLEISADFGHSIEKSSERIFFVVQK